jgi:hypothetical protein
MLISLPGVTFALNRALYAVIPAQNRGAALKSNISLAVKILEFHLTRRNPGRREVSVSKLGLPEHIQRNLHRGRQILILLLICSTGVLRQNSQGRFLIN